MARTTVRHFDLSLPPMSRSAFVLAPSPLAAEWSPREGLPPIKMSPALPFGRLIFADQVVPLRRTQHPPERFMPASFLPNLPPFIILFLHAFTQLSWTSEHCT